MSTVRKEPFYALPFPTAESAVEALKDAPPNSFVEEIEGAWLLLVPVPRPVVPGGEDE